LIAIEQQNDEQHSNAESSSIEYGSEVTKFFLFVSIGNI
jgi:hypothetical protein